MKHIVLIVGLLVFYFGLSSQTITTISPPVGYQNHTLNVTISGQGTHFNQGTTTIATPNPTQVWLKQGEAASIVPNYTIVINDTLILCEFTFSSYHILGSYDLNVFSEMDGFLSMSDAFVLNPDPFSIDDLNETVDHSVYPNPCKGFLNLDTDFQVSTLRFDLFSMNGKLVYSDELDTQLDTHQFDFSLMPKGMYFYHLVSDKKTETGKISLQ
ncbi:MAG: T9SS type A sorting domain-containing protein [Bacteroidales bacterium]|nr:T9SS type A sorting domain-containing protein [Bacteroidales bacterium]MCF8455299.1 T9SS type A sorting domain-containing protein [Bacteroidales bacterium]